MPRSPKDQGVEYAAPTPYPQHIQFYRGTDLLVITWNGIPDIYPASPNSHMIVVAFDGTHYIRWDSIDWTSLVEPVGSLTQLTLHNSGTFTGAPNRCIYVPQIPAPDPQPFRNYYFPNTPVQGWSLPIENNP